MHEISSCSCLKLSYLSLPGFNVTRFAYLMADIIDNFEFMESEFALILACVWREISYLVSSAIKAYQQCSHCLVAYLL